MSLDTILSYVTAFIVPVIIAALILIIGFRIAKKIAITIEKNLNKAPNSDVSLSRFFANLIKYLLMLVVAMAALSVLGVDTTSVFGVITASGYPHEVKIKQHVKSSKGRDSLAKFKALKQKNA